MNMYWIAIIVVVIGSIVGSFGALFLKKGSDNFELSIKSLMHNKTLITGVFLYGLGFLLFIPMLKYADLSILYPLSALTYIWVCFLSKRYLGEVINKPKWIGVLIILLGVVFII